MNSNKKKDVDKYSFEEDIEKLETIVNTLEAGKLPLKDALEQFEVGVKLVRNCETALSNAERKIEMLVQGMNGEPETEPFEEEPDTDVSADNDVSARKSVPRKSAPRKAATPKTSPPDENFPEPPPEEDADEDELF